MAAAVTFFSGDGFTIQNLNGSGLGFFGTGGFGFSVQVSSYQDRTFITNGAGTIQGFEVDNNKFLDGGAFGAEPNVSGVTLLGSGLLLSQLPNYLSTVNIRFTNDTAVTTQNAILYIHDRVSKVNAPSGVKTQVAEIIHIGTDNGPVGSGDSVWIRASGNGATVPMVSGPGMSGFSPAGTATSADRHDWFAAISPTPLSIGSHTEFGLFFELEFL